ncbi:MAG: YabP/YqfC family sporulation protein [Christensenellaceae bacterium]|nr:YabP/YqfC family sporulation protein [Christensenellaceae bacterium]
MKAFLEEITKLTGLDMSLLSDGYRIVNFNSKAMYVEGMQSILSFSQTQIMMKLKKGAIKIAGEKLVIKELMHGSALITGNILSSEVN